MPEINIDLSWFPAWLLWTAGGALYFTIGIVISCLFKIREVRQRHYYFNGCGKVCCPGHVCVGQNNGDKHRCNGILGTTDHDTSDDFCKAGRQASPILWPAVLVISTFVKIFVVVSDLWGEVEQYGLKNVKK